MGLDVIEYKKAPDYVKSPFRYPGGKFYALKHIIPFLDAVPHDEYREPFVGGGSVFFAKRKAKINWINDLEADIINVYREIANQSTVKKFASLFGDEIATRERHAEVSAINPRNDFERAFKTYYLNRTSYSGIIHKPSWGYKEGKSAPPKSWKKFLLSCSDKLSGTKMTTNDFEKVINQSSAGNRTLMYLDPPYYNADQKRAYTKSFESKDHVRLAGVLRNTNHFFCLSYDDCAEVRELYDWAYIYERKWLYNTANVNGKARKLGRELIITNYQAFSQRLF